MVSGRRSCFLLRVILCSALLARESLQEFLTLNTASTLGRKEGRLKGGRSDPYGGLFLLVRGVAIFSRSLYSVKLSEVRSSGAGQDICC